MVAVALRSDRRHLRLSIAFILRAPKIFPRSQTPNDGEVIFVSEALKGVAFYPESIFCVLTSSVNSSIRRLSGSLRPARRMRSGPGTMNSRVPHVGQALGEPSWVRARRFSVGTLRRVNYWADGTIRLARRRSR